jgi:hypothetical protein
VSAPAKWEEAAKIVYADFIDPDFSPRTVDYRAAVKEIDGAVSNA